ncbi:MAG: tol-pal system protein YbgF [Methylobacteriaceae bacterium]|nr:tol-pal system protein YbgF [Methylobacteriaceae bacterium]MBV9812585.1 tol-pal system protein YbgF [Acetobacteraceae bacterium]
MPYRFASSALMISGALVFSAFAADAQSAASPRIELAQFFGQRPPADVDDYGTPGGRQDEAGLSVRVDHLESQLRSLTGQLEQAQFQVRKLQEQLTKFQQDVEFRFQEGAHGSRPAPQRRSEIEPPPVAPTSLPPGVPAGVTPGNPGSLATAGMRRGDAFDPASDPNAPGVPRQLGSISSSATATTPLITREARSEVPMDQGFDEGRDPSRPMDLMRRGRGTASAAPPPAGPLVPITESPPGPAARPLAAPVAAAQPATPAGPPRVIPLTPQAPGPSAPAAQAPGPQVAALPQANPPKSEYEDAVGMLKQGQYDAAEKSFSDFLSKNPKSPLAASAVYNLGETYYLRSRHREAAEQFLKISTAYPSSARAPDAMLRLGQSLNAIGGAKEQACAAFGEVTRKYPNAAASVRAAAEREAKKNQC